MRLTPEREKEIRGSMYQYSECRNELLDEIDALRAELAAYKKAKAENDERFMLKCGEAQQERDRLREAITIAMKNVDNEATLTYLRNVLNGAYTQAAHYSVCSKGVGPVDECHICKNITNSEQRPTMPKESE